MKIRHDESGTVYEIVEEQNGFRLLESSTNRSYTFKEAYEAIWMAIEIIRNSSLQSVAEEHLQTLTKRAKLTVSTPKGLLSSIKKEKITRTYYDQLFLKMLSQYRSGCEILTVSNNSNLSLDHEINFLVRKSLGVGLTIPDYSV